MIEKEVLSDYIDACELVKETEDDIKKLKKQRKAIVQDSVKGSMPEFPYAAQNFHIEGIAYSVIENPERLDEEEALLKERKQKAEGIKVRAEAFLNTVSSRMQRIIRYKIFLRLSWEETAEKMGRGATAESVKKEYQRFMNENESLS